MLESSALERVGLEGVGARVGELVESGEGLFSAVAATAERLESAMLESAGTIAELAGVLRERVGELPELLGGSLAELGAKLESLLGQGIELLERGKAWLEDHPDITSAVMRLGTMVAFIVEDPSRLATIASEKPGVIVDVLDSLRPIAKVFG